MKEKLLLLVRRIIASLVFLVYLVLFLDFTSSIPAPVYNIFLFPQFIPSILKFITLLSFAAAGFLFILLLNLLFGRVYCSFLCPLGIFQDLVARFRKRPSKKKGKYQLFKDFPVLRLSLLFLMLLSVFFVGALGISLLDPYSIFGRIFSDVIRPGFIELNNLLASVLQSQDVYFLYHVHIKVLSPLNYIISGGFLIAISYLAYKYGRLYCNSVCPVGTVLGYLNKISLFKIRINQDKCISCGVCAVECKAGCIDFKAKTVDQSRCIMCFNCLQVCDYDSIHYSVSSIISKENESGDSNPRRKFLFTIAGVTLGSKLMGQEHELVSYSATNKITRKNPVSPPGAESTGRFNKHCTSCHLCVSACPTHVLQPSSLEYGLEGFLQPRMDYKSGFCNFDCILCSEVCPTGAIAPIDLEKKKLTQLGIAHFVKENCIVETEGTDCGACAEHCPTKAVHMVPYGSIRIPEVDEDICVGCGACEYACPTLPFKAIYVEGNPIHLAAKKPKEEKIEKTSTEDFPF